MQHVSVPHCGPFAYDCYAAGSIWRVGLPHLLVEGGGDGAMGVGRACVRAVGR